MLNIANEVSIVTKLRNTSLAKTRWNLNHNDCNCNNSSSVPVFVVSDTSVSVGSSSSEMYRENL